MEINLLAQPPLQGRSGLSRTLETRFSETPFLYFFLALAVITGFFSLMNLFLPLLSGQFRALLSISNYVHVGLFVLASYLSWVLKETSDLRLHLHGERLVYEVKGTGSVCFQFSDIQSLRYEHCQGIFGFFLVLTNGTTFHVPIHLERLDYILDSLHTYRPDLTKTTAFIEFRNKAVALDHLLAHNRSFLSRGPLKVWLSYLFYPLYWRHAIQRVKSNPSFVHRDLIFEKGMERLCHWLGIVIPAAALALILFLMLRS